MEKGSGKGPGLINAGVYMVNTSIIQKISKKSPCSLEYDFSPKWWARVSADMRQKENSLILALPSLTQKQTFFLGS